MLLHVVQPLWGDTYSGAADYQRASLTRILYDTGPKRNDS